jgi:hypothetical protein
VPQRRPLSTPHWIFSKAVDLEFGQVGNNHYFRVPTNRSISMNAQHSKPWFTAKRYGYGSGLPITWQG